jgi:hypothetical protein
MRASRRSFDRVPRPLLYGGAFFATLGLLTPNPLLSAAGALLVPLLFLLLMRPGEPPALLLGAGIQWLAVYLPVVNANFNGLPLGEFYYLPTMELAAWLGLTTILVVALGMRVGVGPCGLINSRRLDDFAVQLDTRRLLYAYLAALGFSLSLPLLTGVFGSAQQLILPLGELRWIFGFMILWGSARGVVPRPLAMSLVLGEVLLGFGSYFAGFRLIIYFAVLAMLSGGGLRVRLFSPAIIGVVILMFSFGLFWQAIKSDYRAFLNQGTGMQAVLVSPEARANFILNKSVNLTTEDLSRGFETMIDRLGYLEYLARSIGQVPEVIPYQNGRLLVEVAQHIFMPRVLFPDKPAISDSDRTNEFTGIRVAGAEQGTSIGIGYAGESYIDFGPIRMFLPIFAYGWFWGWGYRFLVTRSRFALLSVSAAVSFLMPSVTYFEQSNLKLVGGGIVTLVVLSLVLRYFGPRIWGYLVVKEPMLSFRDRPSESEVRMNGG